MRKSTMYSMAIIVIALLGMMIAADMALKPMRDVMAVGRELTAILQARGDVEEGTKVITVARKPEARHLAEEGWGMIVEMHPSRSVSSRKGRLERLAYRAATEAGKLYANGSKRRLEWFEIKMFLAGDVEKRTLILVDDEGRFGPLTPALPAQIP